MIYLDNAATSCPKPPEVIEAVTRSLGEVCANPSRGAYEMSVEASRSMLRTRQAVASLFGVSDPSRIIFTLNATHALNLAIKGLVRAAMDGRPRPRRGGAASPHPVHIVTSSLEHNSVARPLAALARQGVEVTRIPCLSDGTTDPDDILRAVRPNTALVVLTHASNVLGTLLPVEQVGPALRERGIPLLVDAAQTAGSFPIDVQAMGIGLLALSGHKGLLGPQGIGLLYVAPEIELTPLVEGGTGSQSESVEQPRELPDRLEAGTPNSPGIAGLGAGVEVVKRMGIAERGARECALARRLRTRLAELPGLRLYGPPTGTPAAPIVSLAVDGLASAEVAHILATHFGIAVRAGLHCAPEAHRVTGTLATGLVRLSVGHANTEADIDAAVEALTQIVSKPAQYWLKVREASHAR
ncbi:MAG: aminotransferase class V-fold PLP-dependent enzyme [Thermoleophilia bacterium]|nr:aminotransferase class V-fold PLP-dependent enzyme [Thermoleophilia bacterium]